MKKIPIYIFLVITLIGLFSPVFSGQAQEQEPKTCRIYYAYGFGTLKAETTYEACIKYRVGICYVFFDTASPIKITGKSKEECEEQNKTPGQKTYYRVLDTTWDDTNIVVTPERPELVGTQNGMVYQLLEPLPCEEGSSEGCVRDATGKFVLRTFDPSVNSCDKNTRLSEYLNIIITLIIGLCAVLAVIMIVVGGIEYATSELVSSKEAGKERIRGAILGLLLALGAWTILFTINPDLLRLDVDLGCGTSTGTEKSIGTVSYKTQDSGQVRDIKAFYLSKALTGLDPTYCPIIRSTMFKMLIPKEVLAQIFDEVPCRLLNKEACEYATSGVEGIKNPDGSPMRASSILGIFGQETSQGIAFENAKWCVKNTAGMYPANPKEPHPTDPSRTFPGDAELLNEIIAKLPLKYTADGVQVTANNIGLSCRGTGLAGGAMGYTQFLPQTWLAMMKYGKSKGYIDANRAMLDPWNPRDALRMAAIYISYLGGDRTNADLSRSACQFFGGEKKPGEDCMGTGGHTCSMIGGKDTYGNCVIKTVPSMEKFCPSGGGTGNGGDSGSNGSGTGEDGGNSQAASNVTCNSATITAVLKNANSTERNEIWFEWGPDYALSKPPTGHKIITGSGEVSFQLTGLAERVIYSIRPNVKAVMGGITLSGKISYFSTTFCN